MKTALLLFFCSFALIIQAQQSTDTKAQLVEKNRHFILRYQLSQDKLYNPKSLATKDVKYKFIFTVYVQHSGFGMSAIQFDQPLELNLNMGLGASPQKVEVPIQKVEEGMIKTYRFVLLAHEIPFIESIDYQVK